MRVTCIVSDSFYEDKVEELKKEVDSGKAQKEFLSQKGADDIQMTLDVSNFEE